jgi:hypothetical protein
MWADSLVVARQFSDSDVRLGEHFDAPDQATGTQPADAFDG